MIDEQAWIELVRLAQQGQEESKNRLAREAQARVRAYVYRVTLDYDLAQDLSQETLLEMVRSLERLRDAGRFWPWLYRLAHSKIQEYYKYRQKKAAVSASVFYEDFLSQQAGHSEDDGLRHLLREELSKTVMTAMKGVNQRYRAVLSLRCLEQLSYPDIALAMQCSEIRARVLFFRAKQALKRQLAGRGLSKGLLVMALGLFGKVTAPAEGASTVTVLPGSTKVGLTAAALGAVGTKVGVVAVAAAAIGLAALASVSVVSKSEPLLPQRAGVKSFHYTIQLRDSSPGAVASLSKGAYEQSYYFPEGVDGPVFTRMQRRDPRQTRQLCAWLQNGEGSYYYHAGEKQVYMNNYRLYWSSLKVQRLPSDPPELTRFLSEVEGDMRGVEYSRDRKTGLLRTAVDRRFVDAPNFRTNYEYNSLGEEQFRYDWPADVAVVDQRDQMHVRGWTYFRIEGRAGNRTISGRGRVPFVYEAFKEKAPWLTADVGDGLRIIDCSEGACIVRPDGSVAAAYPPGAFFKGLARPWMGMHTIDIVRRDAAAAGIWFDTSPAKNEKEVNVTLLDEHEEGNVELVYTVDLEDDIVKVIKYRLGRQDGGSLTFTYLQDIEQAGSEFVEPALPDEAKGRGEKERGILWLVDLACGRLG